MANKNLIGGLVGGGIIIAIGYYVYTRYKAGDDFGGIIVKPNTYSLSKRINDNLQATLPSQEFAPPNVSDLGLQTGSSDQGDLIGQILKGNAASALPPVLYGSQVPA